MKLLKLTIALAFIANFCVANPEYNDTLDKGYSGIGISFSSLSGDVEGDGIGLSTTFHPGKQNLVIQGQYQYLTADKILGTDVSTFDVEAYSVALGLGYIIELTDKVHLVPNLGYQYTEYGVLGYEAATMDSLVFGAMVRYLILENTVLSAGVNFTSGELDSAIAEVDGLETDATAYAVSVTHHFNDAFSAGIAYGTDNMSADVLGINLVFNF
jgi:hypothetical protein|tara:strand:- start:38 stop:676 length:639 start_codon:yes stop_codon:yes gene_type:complete